MRKQAVGTRCPTFVLPNMPPASKSVRPLSDFSRLARVRPLTPCVFTTSFAVIAVPSDEVIREAQLLVRGGGQVLLFSHTRRGQETALDLATICVDEKDLVGSYSADFLLQEEVARLVFSRKLDVRKLVTHEFPLQRTAEAIQLAARPTADSLKVVVTQEELTKRRRLASCVLSVRTHPHRALAAAATGS